MASTTKIPDDLVEVGPGGYATIQPPKAEEKVAAPSDMVSVDPDYVESQVDLLNPVTKAAAVGAAARPLVKKVLGMDEQTGRQSLETYLRSQIHHKYPGLNLDALEKEVQKIYGPQARVSTMAEVQAALNAVQGPVFGKPTVDLSPYSKNILTGKTRAGQGEMLLKSVGENINPITGQGFGAKTMRTAGRGVIGGAAGVQGASAYNRAQEGDISGAATSGVGALGAALMTSRNPKFKGAGAILQGLSLPGQFMREEKEGYKKGGLVYLAGGKRAIVEEGGSKIMEILKDKMAPLYAKSEGVPARLPRATPKTDAELFEFAQRMSPQVRGDFVPAPGATASVAGKTRAQFEREKGLQHDIRNVRGLTLKPSNYDEAAHQGKVKVGIAGDQTLTGKDVYSIAGNKLSSPSRQYGGSLYPAAHPLGWASEKEAAQGVQNVVDTASKQYGGVDVLGEYMKMSPEANNYAMHNADAIIKSINPSQVKKLEDLNKMIRAKFSDFAGIENQADILKQAQQNPELRKFLDYLVNTKKHAETYGLPSGADMRHALSEPDLRNLEIGASGKSVIEMVPGGKISPSSRKTTTTYSHDIPGDYLGGTKYPRPYQLEFPDSYLALQNKIGTVQDLAKQAVKENPDLDPQTAIQYAKKYANQGFGGFRLSQPRQIMDQQYMDETGKYEDYMKQLLGFKQGGSTTPAWQRSEGKSPSGGLNALGRASYKRETGGELKAPQPEGGSRKKSFCARMGGMKKKLTSSKTANDPDSRINKALRKWKC
jgi:hypothetical protein